MRAVPRTTAPVLVQREVLGTELMMDAARSSGDGSVRCQICQKHMGSGHTAGVWSCAKHESVQGIVRISFLINLDKERIRGAETSGQAKPV